MNDADPQTHERLRSQTARPDTWDAFAGLAERHNGVWNGYNGTRSLFEQAGFSYARRKGKSQCVMRKVIA